MIIYVQLSDVKESLKISNDSNDLQLAQLLRMVEASAQRIINRGPFNDGVGIWATQATTITEFHSGSDTHYLSLRHYPIVEITNLWLDSNGFWGDGIDAEGNPAFADNTLLTLGVDYAVASHEAGILFRINDLWPKVAYNYAYWLSPSVVEMGNIKVEYVWNSVVNEDPDFDVYQGAIIAGVAWALRNIKNGFQGILSDRLGETGWTLAHFNPQFAHGLAEFLTPLLAPIAKLAIG